MPADAKFGAAALIQWCWSHRALKRPSMSTVVDELLNVRILSTLLRDVQLPRQCYWAANKAHHSH